jgi:NAD(P)-dependent dehydrogenase (short-subunit alcohol dehydrogenase family)
LKEELSMKGLTALITGGGSGIGYATAKMFLDAGANVMITGRTQSTLEEAAASLNGGTQLKWMVGDVSSEGHTKMFVQQTTHHFGKLNVLINNAGVFIGGPLLHMEEEDFDDNIDTNLKGTWMMCRYAARPLIDAGGGAIVNVSSYLALRAHISTPSSAYAASKGGVLALTRSLAVELAPHKIRVNAVIPALVNTPMVSDLPGVTDAKELLEKAAKSHPIGRCGEPDDVARAIYFLADPTNSWITGAEIAVDGGRSVL